LTGLDRRIWICINTVYLSSQIISNLKKDNLNKLYNLYFTLQLLVKVKSQTITKPNLREGHTLIVDYNELIYLYSGATNYTISGSYTGNMFILNSINLSWNMASPVNAPGPSVEYSIMLYFYLIKILSI